MKTLTILAVALFAASTASLFAGNPAKDQFNRPSTVVQVKNDAKPSNVPSLALALDQKAQRPVRAITGAPNRR